MSVTLEHCWVESSWEVSPPVSGGRGVDRLAAGRSAPVTAGRGREHVRSTSSARRSRRLSGAAGVLGHLLIRSLELLSLVQLLVEKSETKVKAGAGQLPGHTLVQLGRAA